MGSNGVERIRVNRDGDQWRAFVKKVTILEVL